MECRDCFEWISEYVDGELAAKRLVELEDHLNTCPACRASEQELRELHQGVKGAIESFMLPQGLEERIVRSVWASDRTGQQVRAVWTAFLLAALLSPFFLFLSPVFAMFLNLIYVSGMALWRTGFTLLRSAPAPLSLSLGVAGLVLMGLGSYLVRKLLRETSVNEVFS